MKPSSLNTVPGETREEKIRHLLSVYKILYVQEKLNGVGFRFTYAGGPVFRSVTGKVWPNEFFPARFRYSLCRIACALPDGAVLHGEIVSKDPLCKLATLAGAISINRPAASVEVPYYMAIYDFEAIDTHRPYGMRCTTLASFEWGGRNDHCVDIQILKSTKHDSTKDILAEYENTVLMGGEGIVLRADPCFFVPGVSDQLWKMKVIRSAEGTCISVQEGLGKRRGMLGAMYLKLGPEFGGNTLRLGGGAGMTDELLTRLYTKPPVGKKVTFTYEELSVNNMPLRCQFVAVRDYE